MYKRLITYNFADDETRNSFIEMIEGLSFIHRQIIWLRLG